jgi:class 3 adenylate cyclase
MRPRWCLLSRWSDEVSDDDLRLRTSEVRYARTAHADLAYRIAEGSGGGTRDVVLTNGGTMPMDALYEDPLALRFLEGLADLGRLVMFDRSGIGLSDPPSGSGVSGLALWADDIAAVMDAADVSEPVLVGSRLGADAAIVCCARHPRTVAALVLFEPSYGMRIDRDIVRRQIQGEVDSVALWLPSRADEPGFREWFNSAGQRGASPRLAASAYARIIDDDLRLVEEASSLLKAPTLLLRRPAHPLSPSRADDSILVLLPGATRVDLPGTDMSALGGEVDVLIGEIGRFVTGEHRVPTPDRVLVALLYTDLVSSTARASELGDARWKRVLDRHDELSRSCIERRGGTLVKTMGDGILATLPSATSALRAARELRAGLHAEGLDVRAAIHVGDIDRRGGDISGMNVVVTARLAELANGAEILMSSTALAATAEALSVEARGDHSLKGVRGTWTVYVVADT